MGVVLRTLGAGTYSPFTALGSGTDYVSRYEPYDDYVDTLGVAPPVTGAIGDTQSRPILFSYLQIYSSAGSGGTIDLQIATDADGGGGVHSSSSSTFPITTANNDWAITDSAYGLGYAAFARNSAGAVQTFYYGFQKNDTNTYTFRRGASANTTYNPNAIYQDGVSVTTSSPPWSSTVIYARIRFYTVSSAPQSFVSTGQTSSSVSLDWTAPSDDGATNNVIGGSTTYPYHGIYGYRILTSTDNTNWSVYGSGTSGSPSGTHDVSFGTGTPAPPSSETVSGLTSNTNYYFKVAALNIVTDGHNGATVTPATSRTFGNYTSVADHTGTNASLGPVRTNLAAPTVSGSYTSTANVNVAYSSNVTWTQASGGGVVATTLTYDLASGSLSGSGLSLNTSTGEISGTPTVAGTYTFTVRATNLDSGTVTTSSQTITIRGLGPLVSPSAAATPSARGSVKVWNGTSFVDGTMRVYDGTDPYNISGWKYLK